MDLLMLLGLMAIFLFVETKFAKLYRLLKYIADNQLTAIDIIKGENK